MIWFFYWRGWNDVRLQTPSPDTKFPMFAPLGRGRYHSAPSLIKKDTVSRGVRVIPGEGNKTFVRSG